MAVSRLTQTTLQNGFEKFGRVWDGRSAVGSMEAISAITLTSAQSSIEFNNIPSTYTHLQVRYIARDDGGRSFATWMYARFNGDTNSNYARHRLNGRGDALIYSDAQASISFAIIGYSAGNTGLGSQYAPGIVDILDYSNTNKFKTCRTITGSNGQTTSTEDDVAFISSVWLSSNAINSILIYSAGGNLLSNSSFSLYGIK